MMVRYDPALLQRLKKIDVRIRKSFKKCIAIFTKDPFNQQLNNHPLKREYRGYRSINVTNDWRALYSEKMEGENIIAYFSAIGTHDELYRKSKKD